MELIEVLWRQDIDLGIGREMFESSLRQEPDDNEISAEKNLTKVYSPFQHLWFFPLLRWLYTCVNANVSCFLLSCDEILLGFFFKEIKKVEEADSGENRGSFPVLDLSANYVIDGETGVLKMLNAILTVTLE